MFSWLQQHEAAAGYDAMRKLKLHGQVEGDGTALRLFKYDSKKHYIAMWGLVRLEVCVPVVASISPRKGTGQT